MMGRSFIHYIFIRLVSKSGERSLDKTITVYYVINTYPISPSALSSSTPSSSILPPVDCFEFMTSFTSLFLLLTVHRGIVSASAIISCLFLYKRMNSQTGDRKVYRNEYSLYFISCFPIFHLSFHRLSRIWYSTGTI